MSCAGDLSFNFFRMFFRWELMVWMLTNSFSAISAVLKPFAINSSTKLKDFSDTLSKILKSKTHKFNIDGKYLIENGMQQGLLVGKALKEIEEEWIKNNFQITKERVKEIIHTYSN